MPNITKSSKTLEQYFVNGKREYENPYTIKRVNGLNINVEIYYNRLGSKKLKKIQSNIEQVLKDYSKQGLFDNPNEMKIIKLHIFNKRSDYLHYGDKFNLGLGDSGGITFRGREKDIVANIYVYKHGDIVNLKHEFIHAFNMVENDNDLPSLINEGMAETLAHSADLSVQGSSVDFSIKQMEKVIGDFDLDKMLKLTHSNDYITEHFLYTLGHSLIMYFNQKDPSIMSEYLNKFRQVGDDANHILFSNYDRSAFKKFLQENMTETEMGAIHALKVVKGEKIGEGLAWVNAKQEKVTYYKADIHTIKGQKVGEFSFANHYFNNMYSNPNIRVDGFNALDIESEYHYMKVIRTEKGDLKWVYCNQKGEEYSSSSLYKSQLEIIKKSLLNVEDYQKVIEELTYFDLSSVQDIQGQKFSNYFIENCIFTLKSLGVEQDQGLHGISIFYNDQKIAELSGSKALVKVIQDSEDVIFADVFMSLNRQYLEQVYVGLQKEGNNYQLKILEGKQHPKDEYFDMHHTHFNPILHPNPNAIKDNFKESLLLNQNVNLLDHKDSEVVQYPKDYSSSNPIVKVGNLLNDHGTEAKDDDVYEANIELYSNPIYTFKNISFKITSDDEKLSVMDKAKNIGYGFPKVITHLKLIKTANDKGISEYRLVPCTKDGDEKPEGMPNIPDKYRLIDPIFAHNYEKEEHSHEHVTIGLIDFSKYTEGILFRMHHDPNDPSIIKDEKGNILKLEDTKVKLYDPNGNEVGILSRDYHHFKGEIFFSIDSNYQEGFFASYAPYLGQKILADGTRAVFFQEGKGDITNNNYPDYKNVPIESITSLHNTKKLSTEDSVNMLKDNSSVNSDTTLKPTHDPDTIVFVYDAPSKQYFVYNCKDKDLNQFEEQGQDSTYIYNKLKNHHDIVHKDSISAEDRIIVYHNKSRIIYENGRVELDLHDYNTRYQPIISEDKYISEFFIYTYDGIYHSIIDKDIKYHQEFYNGLIDEIIQDSANMLKDDPRVNSDTTFKPTHNPDTIIFVYDSITPQYHVVQCKSEDIREIESKAINSNIIYDNFKVCNNVQTYDLPANMTYIIYHKQSKILYDSSHLELDYRNTHYNIKDQDTLKIVSDVYQRIYDNRDNPLQDAYLDWDHQFVIGKIIEAYDAL